MADTSASKPPRTTAADVRAALINRYRAPEWACFFEVAHSTGAGASRSADAIAMSLYPSRGLRLHGFEIKVSRSDWLHELKRPDKSVAIQRFCDHWWIVTPPDIVRDGELPPTWGHLILKGNGFNCATKAPQLDRDQWEPAFLAALLRRGHEARERAIREGVDAAMAAERAAIAAEVEQRVKREVSMRSSARDESVKQLARIQEAAGLDPERYFDGEGLGRAIGLVHRLGVASTYSMLESAAKQARAFAASVDAVQGVNGVQHEGGAGVSKRMIRPGERCANVARKGQIYATCVSPLNIFVPATFSCGSRTPQKSARRMACSAVRLGVTPARHLPTRINFLRPAGLCHNL